MRKGFSTPFTIVLCTWLSSGLVAEVLDGPQGPVEFIGLENWTAQDLYDTIQELDPDEPFHACAAVMIEELNFADAAAHSFFEQKDDGSNEMYTVVVGIEDRSLVQYRATGSETIDIPEAWQPILAAIEENVQTMVTATYVHFLLTSPHFAMQTVELSEEEAKSSIYQTVEMLGSTKAAFDLLDEFIQTELKRSGRDFAHDVLSKSDSWSARFVATVTIALYPEIESSWISLAKSLIDPAPQVRDLAERLLESLVRTERAVPVNWTSARNTLISLLGGTNPFAFTEMLDVLVATKIDHNFAKEIVQHRPKLLLGFVGAKHKSTQQKAHAFLTTISGEDFAANSKAWGDWIATEETTNVQ